MITLNLDIEQAEAIVDALKQLPSHWSTDHLMMCKRLEERLEEEIELERNADPGTL